MKSNRRTFVKASLAGGAAALSAGALGNPAIATDASAAANPRYAVLDEILARPVFKKGLFKDPVLVESVELLRKDRSFLCRVRSKDGAEGISVAHSTMNILYPIFVHQLQSFFEGQDARRLDDLLEKALVRHFNFRLDGLALGIPLATIEFAILDMMGRIAGKPVGSLIGNIHNTHVPVYQATEWREKSVEESVELIRAAVEKSRAQAVKIKVGSLMFMTDDLDATGPAGRTEQIIPLIRKTFGDDMALYADANGYYDVDEAIRVGKLLEQYNYAYFEEPVHYNWLEGTKRVADALSLPVAGGEQQHGLYPFRWLIANDGLDIVQPDQYYFGGMIRSMQVARMAHAFDKLCIPHLSGGFGFIYMLHFVSAIPNSGAHIEFKGYTDIPIECPTSSLRVEDGKIKVPTGPGIGVDIDPDYVAQFSVVRNV